MGATFFNRRAHTVTMSRRGVSPVLGAVLMVLIVTGIATGVVLRVEGVRDIVIGKTEQPRLETINTTCTADRVTWWIRNDAPHRVDATAADLFISRDGTLNTTASRTGLTVTAAFTAPDTAGRLQVAPGRPLRIGRTYDLQLVMGDADVRSRCRVGQQWWDAGWPHRRTIRNTTADTTLNVTLDATPLRDAQRLRPDCGDVRPVHDGSVIPHRAVRCDTALWLHVNATRTAPGDTYLYYGNLQATSAARPTLDYAATNGSAVLGPEETLRVPQ